MIRLTGYDQNMELLVKEEERILSSKGFIDKDEMYKIMMHLAEKLADYENLEEQGKLLKLPFKPGDTVYELSKGFIEPCTVKTIYIEDYTDKEENSTFVCLCHKNPYRERHTYPHLPVCAGNMERNYSRL